jgi:hypothetical protein
MDGAFISAVAAILVAAVSIFLTKQKEREAEWRSKKLAYYEEFFAAASGIIGEVEVVSAKVRFANSVNQLHLFASQNVINALHKFLAETAGSNKIRTPGLQDALWSKIVWYIRQDLGIKPTSPLEQFVSVTWASGTGSNVVVGIKDDASVRHKPKIE